MALINMILQTFNMSVLILDDINLIASQYQQMQKQYKNLYFMMTKHNPFPSNCLPFNDKTKNSENLKKLMNISLSITSLVNNNVEEINHKRRGSQYQIINFKKNFEDRHASSKRIHHNYSHFIAAQTARLSNPKQTLNMEEQKSTHKYETIQEKVNSTTIPKRKDLYDNHIEKYMTTKYDNEELIKQYLTNREMFIQEAVEEIEKDIKQEIPLNKRSIDGKRPKKYRSSLPKIEEATSHMLQKSIQRKKDGAYIQDLNQIKKAQQLKLKERRRRLRVFRHKMTSLQARLSQVKLPK